MCQKQYALPQDPPGERMKVLKSPFSKDFIWSGESPVQTEGGKLPLVRKADYAATRQVACADCSGFLVYEPKGPSRRGPKI
jgi:hypothetical protein